MALRRPPSLLVRALDEDALAAVAAHVHDDDAYPNPYPNPYPKPNPNPGGRQIGMRLARPAGGLLEI
jgi:hypothetical protein